MTDQSNLPMITLDYSMTATGTSALAFAQLGYVPKYMRVWNVSAVDTTWCSRSGPAVVGGAGSFPLGPGEYELYVSGQTIPANALQIISTGTSTPVTIEVGH